MTKRGNPPKIDETDPVGEVVDPGEHIAVTARVVWNYGGPMDIDNAWVIAWTREQVLVMFMVPPIKYPTVVWLRSDQVKRR
jgi:hypothetical protein